MAELVKGLLIEEKWTAGSRKARYMLAGKCEAVNGSKAFRQVLLVKNPGFVSSESRCPWHFCLVRGERGAVKDGAMTERL